MYVYKLKSEYIPSFPPSFLLFTVLFSFSHSAIPYLEFFFFLSFFLSFFCFFFFHLFYQIWNHFSSFSSLSLPFFFLSLNESYRICIYIYNDIYMYTCIYVFIIMSCHEHGFPGLSLSIRLYHPSHSAGPPDYILCPYRAVLEKF